MTTVLTADEKREARAAAERDRRAKKRAEEFGAVAARAASFVPESYNARFTPEDVEAIKVIVGRADPVRFAFDGEPGPEDGRDGKMLLVQFAQGELTGADPAAAQIRRVSRRVRSDERAPVSGKYPSLWGRKVAALLLALAE